MMNAPVSGFEFCDEVDAVAARRAIKKNRSVAEANNSSEIVIRISNRLRHKRDLLACFASALSFPKYFGWNWDAFEECIRDLSWLPAGCSVAVLHESLPFRPGDRRLREYLGLLRDFSGQRRAATAPTFRFIFRTADRDRVLALCAESE